MAAPGVHPVSSRPRTSVPEVPNETAEIKARLTPDASRGRATMSVVGSVLS